MRRSRRTGRISISWKTCQLRRSLWIQSWCLKAFTPVNGRSCWHLRYLNELASRHMHCSQLRSPCLSPWSRGVHRFRVEDSGAHHRECSRFTGGSPLVSLLPSGGRSSSEPGLSLLFSTATAREVLTAYSAADTNDQGSDRVCRKPGASKQHPQGNKQSAPLQRAGVYQWGV